MNRLAFALRGALPGICPFGCRQRYPSKGITFTMTRVANTLTYVIDVDTHSRTHTVAVVSAANGALETSPTFRTTPASLTGAVS